MEMKPIVYRGAKEICGAVGVPWKEISHYVRDRGLPAFKINGSGTWIAIPEDLDQWIKQQRDLYLREKKR